MHILRWLLLGGWMPARLWPDVAMTALRVFTGLAIALGHGWGKVSDPSGIIGRSETMGLPLPTVAGWLSALAEFVGGLLLAAGLLTRGAAALVFINMTVAWLGWHWLHQGDPFGTMELALLYWFVALQFVIVGAGRFGVDRLLRR